MLSIRPRLCGAGTIFVNSFRPLFSITGVGAATKGVLTFMVGGSKESYDRATPLLECMGKAVMHCGESGAGQATKICNNMILGISMIGVSEALQLGVK